VPESEAKKLTGLKDIVLVSSMVKSLGNAEAALEKENAALKAEVAKLTAQVQDFLGAQSKKDLETLQAKHGTEPEKAAE
jgi:cell division protein FtsB